jgi:hypothetical protein
MTLWGSHMAAPSRHARQDRSSVLHDSKLHMNTPGLIVTSPNRIRAIVRRIIREPLLHFAVLGAAMFVGYALFRPTSSDSSAIVVSSDRIGAIVAQFRAMWQRPPSRGELNALVESFVRDEVFYREGMALGLDRDDLIVRNRVKQKIEVLSEEAMAIEPSEADLQKYLGDHRDVFAIAAATSFDQVYFRSERDGQPLEGDVQQALTALNAGANAINYGERTLLPPRMDRALPGDIAGVFGDAFAKAIGEIAPGRWSGPIRSSFGLHLVRVTSKDTPVVPGLAQVHDLVLREWTHARMVDAREQLYRSLRKRYTVSIADAPVTLIAGRQR